MEIMPHIKALLDDLIKMTSHITVKRTDLANKYENNNDTLQLYLQAVQVLDGMSTFKTYNKFPKEVLRNLSLWEKTDDKYLFGALKPLTNLPETIISKMSDGSHQMTISSSRPSMDDHISNVGNGWVYDTGNGYLSTIYNKEYKTKTFDIMYNPIDTSTGNIDINTNIPNIIMPNDSFYSMKRLSLYIYDDKYEEYVPINIDFISEYVLLEKIEGTYKIPTDSEYIWDENFFVEDKLKGNGKLIINNDLSSISSDENVYAHRYKFNIIYADNRYYSHEVYIEKNAILDDTLYSRLDNLEYYLSDSGAYNPIYEKSIYGTYVYEDNQFVELTEEQLKTADVNSLYVKTVNDVSLVYYLYYYKNANVVVNSTYTTELGGIFNRYKTYKGLENEELNDTMIIYYNYEEEPNPSNVNQVAITVADSTNTEIIDVAKDKDGNEVYIPDTYDKFYVYKDPEGQYTKKSYYYEKSISVSDEKYSISETIEGTHGLLYEKCIYINKDAEYYICNQLFTNDQINEYYKHPNAVPTSPSWIRESLTTLMNNYVLKKYCPTYGNTDYLVPLYTGETNRYYREINGLPPLNNSNANPRINRLTINPDYTGKYLTPYIFELTDAEIDMMEKSGLLKTYQDAYPTLKYLHFLGSNRIDVIKARQAAPYDILKIDDSEMMLTKSIFNENYNIAKNYIFKKHYKPDMFGQHQYYHAYIGFVICVLAMIMCITKSGEILIQNKFIDQKTVDLVLKSYGFENTFSSIPLVYRREIAKNIVKLIRNKGIDSIYDIVYKLFDISDVEVYKYFFRKSINTTGDGELLFNKTKCKKCNYSSSETFDKCPNCGSTNIEYDAPDYDISISQVPISSDNITKDIVDPSNKLNYNDITSGDRYWGVYESDESVKNKIKDMAFNYMNSKYITLNNRFNLTELNFNSSYLLNYLLETSKINNSNILIDIDEMSEPQKLENLLIMLFAIQSIKYKFDGNIPNDIVSAAAVYKFNLDKTVVGDDGKAKKIIDYYIDYMDAESAKDVTNIESQINKIYEYNSMHDADPSIRGAIYNDKHDVSITELSETYLMNINDSSLYKKLISLRENANTVNDFICFDQLLKCISICKETDQVYKLETPVWELMYDSIYKYDDEKEEFNKYDENIHYLDIRNHWVLVKSPEKEEIYNKLGEPIKLRKNDDGSYTKIDDETYVGKIYYDHFSNIPSNILVTTSRPGILDVSENIDTVICINDISKKEFLDVENLEELNDRIEVYKKINILNELNYEEYLKVLSLSKDKENYAKLNTKYISIGVNNYAYIGNYPLETFISTEEFNSPILYIEVIPTDDIQPEYSLKIYRRCTNALTYAMYLREMAPELYEYLNRKSGESYEDYIERLNKFNSTIIATIEDNIESETIKNKLKISYADFSNISKYIKLIINVFKSYSIDLSSMDVIYNIDDDINNRFKIIDDFSTNETYAIDSNLHIRSDIASEEIYHTNDTLKINDEIYIEYYTNKSIDIDTNNSDT